MSVRGYVTFERVLAPSIAEEIKHDVDQVLAENRHLPHGELIKKFENSDLFQRTVDLPALRLAGV